jgi:hypothetical protein
MLSTLQLKRKQMIHVMTKQFTHSLKLDMD